MSQKSLIIRLLLTLVLIALIAGTLGGIWYHHFQQGIKQLEQPRPATTVTATKAVVEHWAPYIQATGTMTAVEGVNVTTKSAGQIKKILFQSGEHVTKGQPLVQLSTSTMVPQVDKAKAALRLAEIDYERQLKLREQQANSKADLDTAAAQLDQSKAEVAQLQAELNNKTIVAPFSGVAGIRQVNIGQYIQPGNAIVSLQTYDPIYVDFEIPGNQISQIQVGQTMQVFAEGYPRKTFTGKVSAIDSAVNNNTRSVNVRAELANPDSQLMPGMFVTVKVLLPTLQDAIVVPETAVNYTLYGNTVYVVDTKTIDNKPETVVKEVTVTTGMSENGLINITSGLAAGNLVVTSGQMKINNGQVVAVKPGPEASKESATTANHTAQEKAAK